ncbi:MAG TPA: hypothetical protein VF516_30510 [Kofleriaceae bacterium]
MSRIPLPPLVLMVAAAACTGRSPAQPTPPAGAERTPAQPTPRGDAERAPAQPTPRGDEDPITEIRELWDLLSTDPLRADAVVRRIGSIIKDSGRELYIAPSNRRFQAASVYREPKNGDVDIVDLTPAATQRPTVGALRAAFGPYEDASSLHFDVPATLRFNTYHPGGPCTVTLFADLAEVGFDPPPTAAIGSFTFQRVCL